MIKIVATIDDINYEIPEEITVSHYAEIMRRTKMSETEYEKAMDIISVLMEIPYQIIRELEPERLIELSTYLHAELESCSIEFQNKFKWKGVEYGAINLNKMTFGEYIDLANMMRNDKYVYMNIHKISAILYRPILAKDGDDYTIAPYELNAHEKQSLLFKDLPVKYFFGAFMNLYNYYTQIKKDFNVLFDEDRLDLPEKKKDREKDEEEESTLPWYKMIMALVNEDFTKINYATTRPVVECFNHLTYITLKNAELRQKQLEWENKNKVM